MYVGTFQLNKYVESPDIKRFFSFNQVLRKF